MMRICSSESILIFALLSAASPAFADDAVADSAASVPAPRAELAREPRRPVHTYSIVARDPATGDLGVAVQSHWFGVGSAVPWAEAGVGAVATQSFADMSYGGLGLSLMRGGKPAPQALKALLLMDEQRETRQVAMVDARGRVATHTGKLCIEAAGHQIGEGFSVQANMMTGTSVWPAMAKAFREQRGELVDRLLAALQAAQHEGGDFRGQQSAAVIVVRAQATGQVWNDRLYDLRVEDHPEPVAELSRLVQLQKAYHLMDAGDTHVTKGRWKEASEAYGAAIKLAPNVPEMPFWFAVALVNGGKVAEALPIFKDVFRREPQWRGAIRRLSRAQQLPKDEKLLKQIEAQ